MKLTFRYIKVTLFWFQITTQHFYSLLSLETHQQHQPHQLLWEKTASINNNQWAITLGTACMDALLPSSPSLLYQMQQATHHRSMYWLYVLSYFSDFPVICSRCWWRRLDEKCFTGWMHLHAVHHCWVGWEINIPFQHKNMLYLRQDLGWFSSASLRMANDTVTSRPRCLFCSATT